MTTLASSRLRTLQLVPLLALVALVVVFSSIYPRFATIDNLLNILTQGAPLAIASAGMAFVLLTAGVDLSAGSVMFLAAVVAGKSALAGLPLAVVLAAAVAVGAVCGGLNAVLVARFRFVPFIVTLGTLYLWRGLGLEISQTRAMNLPEDLRSVASAFLGIPIPIWILAGVVAAASVLLKRTGFGRQIYAVGHDAEAARKAGVPVVGVLAFVYLASGFCAGLMGLISIAQMGAVSPTFGEQREFSTIAAAVLGGVSLFGGRGTVFPGALLGALVIQAIDNALVIAGADPYLYPVITAAVIFIAVLLDSIRHRRLQIMTRRRTRRCERNESQEKVDVEAQRRTQRIDRRA
jgi:ribose transport system permease protein